MEVPVLMFNGATEGVLIKNFDTAKDVVASVLSNLPAEERAKYQLFEVKKGRDGIAMERGLKDNTIVSEVKKGWAQEKESVFVFKLVKLEHEAVVNFNTYFRMMAGVSETRAKFPISSATTVGELNDTIKAHLKLPAAEVRFGLLGNYGNGKDLRKLSREEKVLNLKTAWETPDFQFFQFQVLPEMEDKKHLGADKEGYLEVYQKFPPLWKRRFCSLRGNCLFVFKEKGEVNEISQVPHLDDGTVTATGNTKKGLGQKFSFRFEINVEDQDYEFAAEDQQGMVTWVEAIKSCRTRNDARALSNPNNAKQPQRTFVPIANAPAVTAEKAKQQEELSVSSKQDSALEELKKAAETLVEARGAALVAGTKTLVTAAQTFTVLVNQGINEKTHPSKKAKIDENGNKAKLALKAIIPAAKAVGVLQNSAENSAELRTLKKEVQTLTDSSEIMLINLRMDDDDFLLESIAISSTQKPKEFQQAPTGNQALDSLVSNFNMFGIAPELAEMMRQAAAMPESEDTEPDYSSQAMPVADDGLDSILNSLNSALDGINVPTSTKAPVQHSDSAWDLNSQGDRCALCFDVIKGRVVKGIGRTWHPDCFYCTQCGRNLENDNKEEVFEGPGGMPYCKKDFTPLCPKCPGCLQAVFPKEVFNAFGKAYHKKCFRCQTCSAAIDGQAFEVNGKPQCEMCYHESQGTVCSYCLKPIYGNALTILGKKRHPECFICAYCKKNLTKDTAKAKGDKLYCATCNIQING